ncbi:GAF domain-containing protein [Zavarzinia sp. CC-PAN008]|uniref:GAF domain-containing protein n=1 Tax=Zavarzinia sp. CC-PAN008 TaxID=3243332 RepID=UPI003F748535
MFEAEVLPDALDKPGFYRVLAQQLTALLEGERDWIANAANTAALIFTSLPDLNWAGFYFLKPGPAGGELVLGPFQGRPACVRIALGRGVCGTAAATRQAQVVADVHAFPGHIACDPASRSELVVPLLGGGRVVGVLDLDSPVPGRFDAEDRAGVAELARIFLDSSEAVAA